MTIYHDSVIRPVWNTFIFSVASPTCPSNPIILEDSINERRYINEGITPTPSTTRSSPQTYWLALLARKTTGPAKSLGSPQRAAGIRSDIWRRRIGSANSFSFLIEHQRVALLGHMKRIMKFEKSRGTGHWQGRARLRLGKIRLRAADGPEAMGAFLADVSVGAAVKRGNRDYGRSLVRCPRKEGDFVATLTYRWRYSPDRCR